MFQVVKQAVMTTNLPRMFLRCSTWKGPRKVTLPSVFNCNSPICRGVTTLVDSQKSSSEAVPKPVSQAPGFPSLPMFGSLLSLVFHKDFDWNATHKLFLAASKEFGKIYRLHFPGMPKGVVVTDPDDFEKVFRVTLDNPVRFGFTAWKQVRDKAEDNYFNKQAGILVENGEEWRRVRSQVQTPMMKPKIVAKFIPVMDSVAMDFMDRIRELQDKFGEMPEDFLEEMYRFALESVGTVAFNKRLGCLDPNLPSSSEQLQLINAVNEIFTIAFKVQMSLQLWRWFPTPSYTKLKRAHDTLCRITKANIKQTIEDLNKKKASTQDDLTLMEMLLSNPKLHERDVVTMILDMIFAGIDTTSHTLGFCLYLLAKNPGAQDKLYREIASVLPDKKAPITASHLGQLSFLKACVKETFRLFPLVFGAARVLDVDVVLSDYLIPKGSSVFMINMVSTKNEKYFPRPDDFVPERWLRGQQIAEIHPFASLPFSHGTRMCIGRRIAEQEMYIFLTRVLQNFVVGYNYGEMGIKTKTVNMPSEPLKFTFRERN